MAAEDHSWFTGSLVRENQSALRNVRMNFSAVICYALGQGSNGRGLEVGDVATLREALDILDRIYALENALSPDWRTK